MAVHTRFPKAFIFVLVCGICYKKRQKKNVYEFDEYCRTGWTVNRLSIAATILNIRPPPPFFLVKSVLASSFLALVATVKQPV